MRKLFYPLLFLISLSIAPTSFAQTCRIDIIALKANVKRDPDSVLYTLGDALALRPDCIGELVEAAIVSSDGSRETISQIVKLAVIEYPGDAVKIAEAAILASPGNATTIRNAFETAKDPRPVNPAVNPYELKSRSKLITNYQTSKPVDPEDAANKGIAEIDKILAEIKSKSGGKKRATITAVPVEMEKAIEEFRMVKLDEASVSTIYDQSDQNDELLAVAEGSLFIEDPKIETPAPKMETKKLAKLSKEETTEQLIGMLVQDEIKSSVYHIPSSGPGAKVEIPSLSDFKPILRSRSASPTVPVKK